MPLDPKCQAIATEIIDLEGERASVQEELRNAPTTSKAHLASIVKRLNAQSQRRKLDLDACNSEHPPTEPPPVPQPLTAYFNGTSTFRTTFERAPGPFASPVSGVLYFSADRRLVRLIDLGSVTTEPYEVPVWGTSTTTMSLDRNGGDTGGAYDPGSGALSLRLPLYVDHSVDVPFVVEDSTLVLFMTTDGVPGTDFGDLPGSPLDANGRLVASGSGPFRNGFLDGKIAGLTLDGTLTPRP